MMRWSFRVRSTLWAVGLLVASSSTCAQVHRFTYTNPTIGSTSSPFVLEYFSLVDCIPCRAFEIGELNDVLSAVVDGTLRIVFRDLVPAENVEREGVELFCLQELDDFVDTRITAKRTGDYTQSGALLRDRRLARWEQCLEGKAALEIMAHNQRSFDAYGFVGTPSFILSLEHEGTRTDVSWSGRTEAETIFDAIHTTLNESNKPAVARSGAQKRRLTP